MKTRQHTSGGVSVQVKGKNLSISPTLHNQVVRKMERLDKYLDRLQEIEVELGVEHTRAAGRHNRVEATGLVFGRVIRVVASGADMYTAIDEAVDKLYRQLNRQKEKMKSHHGGKLSEEIVVEPVSNEDTSSLDGEMDAQPVIIIEHIDMKPQFEDEAMEELQAGRQGFYVFLNAQSEQINVLYRHSDGTFGLIQPRTG
jgi:putative sigma-54 modulation protein